MSEGGLRQDRASERAVRHRFDEFEFDPSAGCLRRRGAEVPLTAKPLGVLARLLAEPGRVVAREELLATVWPSTHVSDAALASALRDLRRALGDDSARPRFVRTVRGVGFRFAGEVELVEAPAADRGFVGRLGVLRRAEALLGQVRVDVGGRCLWLAGDPGIGKTRLLVELAARAEAVGVETCFGRCLEEAGAAPLRRSRAARRFRTGSAGSSARTGRRFRETPRGRTEASGSGGTRARSSPTTRLRATAPTGSTPATELRSSETVSTRTPATE